MPRSSPPDSFGLELRDVGARASDVDVIEEAAEAKAAFHLRLRARGVQDLAVLRAMELVPRHRFVPHRYQDLAARDLALPLDCGQTLNEPWLMAKMIEALSLERSHRVLEIGAGSGYSTAILAHLCREVIALERFQSLATSAQGRLTDLGIAHAAVVWGDGFAVPPEVGTFDRILVHGLLTELPPKLMDCLAEDGVLVAARPDGAGQAIKRVTRAEGDSTEILVCAARFQPIIGGLAVTL